MPKAEYKKSSVFRLLPNFTTNTTIKLLKDMKIYYIKNYTTHINNIK